MLHRRSSLHAVAATSARWRAVDHAARRPTQATGREGAARDDPNNKAYDAFLKYATLKFACVDVLDPAKATSAEPAGARDEFCAERFLERYDKIIEMVDAEIEKGTSGRLKDLSRASALGLGRSDYNAPRRSSEAEGGGRGAMLARRRTRTRSPRSRRRRSSRRPRGKADEG